MLSAELGSSGKTLSPMSLLPVMGARYDSQGQLLESWGNGDVDKQALEELRDHDPGTFYHVIGGAPRLVAISRVKADFPFPVALLVFSLDEPFIHELSRRSGLSVSVLGADSPSFSSTLIASLRPRLVLPNALGTPAIILSAPSPALNLKLRLSRLSSLSIVILSAAIFLFLGLSFILNRGLYLPLGALQQALASEVMGQGPHLEELRSLSAAPGEFSGLAGALLRRLEYGQANTSEAGLQRNRAELLRQSAEPGIYRSVMEGSSEGLVITDLEGSILDANDALCKMAGFSKEELLGQNPRIMKSDRHEAGFYTAMWESLTTIGSWCGEIWDRRKDGSVYPKWLDIRTIRDSSGKPQYYLGLSSDNSRLKQVEDRMNRLAFYDSLTGLPNRHLFLDRLECAVSHARRNSSRLALLYLDIDGFKAVNESYGHLCGDELLALVADRITERSREVDSVCRLGGDEFAIILDELERSEGSGELADELLRILHQPYLLRDHEIFVSASIGIAIFPFDGTDSQGLIRAAESAMYHAKNEGRNCFRYASGDFDKRSRLRMDIAVQLRRALQLDEFILHYQPQVSAGAAIPASCSGLIGAEALIRRRTPDGMILGPGSFIDVAEETGLIVPIGRWAIMEACRQGAVWQRKGRPFLMSVNVSVRQFERGSLAETVRDALETTGLPPSCLKLEITESLFMRDKRRVVATMEELRQMGILFAVDDFGVGFSSLQYLNQLPIDCLKIDKAFIDRIEDGMSGGETVTAIIALARAYGLSSVAEGVETETQLQALRMRGADEIQGYLVSRPLAPEAFEAYMAEEEGLAPLELGQ